MHRVCSIVLLLLSCHLGDTASLTDRMPRTKPFCVSSTA